LFCLFVLPAAVAYHARIFTRRDYLFTVATSTGKQIIRKKAIASKLAPVKFSYLDNYLVKGCILMNLYSFLSAAEALSHKPKQFSNADELLSK